MKLAMIQVGAGQRPKAAIVCADGSYLEIEYILQQGGYAGTSSIALLTFLTRPYIVDKINEEMHRLERSEAVAATLYPSDTPLCCPLPRPNRILAIGRNYSEHAKELGNTVGEEPIVFQKASTCVIGPNEAIEIPAWVGRVDYEAELLVVIGTGGKNIAEADAMQHVIGYSVFNDITAREKQKAAQEKKHPWFLAKSLDTFGPLGPYLVTVDEIADPHNLRVSLISKWGRRGRTIPPRQWSTISPP